MKTLILLALILSTTIAFAGSISYNYEQKDSVPIPEPCLFIIFNLLFIIYYRIKF